MKKANSFVLVFACLLLAGCAQKDDKIEKIYANNRVTYADTRPQAHNVEYSATLGEKLMGFTIKSKDGTILRAYEITDAEEDAESCNSANARLDRPQLLPDCHWRQSAFGRTWTGNFNRVRRDYSVTHNEVYTEPPMPVYHDEQQKKFVAALKLCAGKNEALQKTTVNPDDKNYVQKYLDNQMCLDGLFKLWDSLAEPDKKDITFQKENRLLFFQAGFNLDTRNPVRFLNEESRDRKGQASKRPDPKPWQ